MPPARSVALEAVTKHQCRDSSMHVSLCADLHGVGHAAALVVLRLERRKAAQVRLTCSKSSTSLRLLIFIACLAVRLLPSKRPRLCTSRQERLKSITWAGG